MCSLRTQLVRVLSGPGQPDRKVVAEPPQLIVPAASTKRQRQVGQVGVLFAEQLCNQIRGDLIFSARHRSNVAQPRSFAILTVWAEVMGGRRFQGLAVPVAGAQAGSPLSCSRVTCGQWSAGVFVLFLFVRATAKIHAYSRAFAVALPGQSAGRAAARQTNRA